MDYKSKTFGFLKVLQTVKPRREMKRQRTLSHSFQYQTSMALPPQDATMNHFNFEPRWDLIRNHRKPELASKPEDIQAITSHLLYEE